MTIAAEDYLRLAEQLRDSSSQESEYRAVIYLAYYGLFLLIRDALGITHKGGRVHGIVERGLRKQAPAQADALKTLRTLRNDSSYDLTITFSQGDARGAIALARAVEADLRAKGII